MKLQEVSPWHEPGSGQTWNTAQYCKFLFCLTWIVMRRSRDSDKGQTLPFALALSTANSPHLRCPQLRGLLLAAEIQALRGSDRSTRACLGQRWLLRAEDLRGRAKTWQRTTEKLAAHPAPAEGAGTLQWEPLVRVREVQPLLQEQPSLLPSNIPKQLFSNSPSQ